MSSLTLTNYNPIPNSTNSKSSLNIDYNYPSLNRKDTMYLSTMTHNDFPIRKFKQLQTKRNWSINLYNLDIEGSSHRKFGAFHQKIDFINKNDDIEKSFPKKLHIKLKKPEYNLSNSLTSYRLWKVKVAASKIHIPSEKTSDLYVINLLTSFSLFEAV